MHKGVAVAGSKRNPGEAHPDRSEWIVCGLFAVVLVLFVAVRLYHAGMPLIDDSDWRQTDTASEAWFFLHDGLRLLPQLFYDGPGPNYVQLEVPFLPWTVAVLAHWLPFGNWLLHGVAVAYSAASLIFLWLFLRRRMGARIALLATAVYSVQPLGIFFGRAFQPEPAMMAGSLAALWATDRWAARGGAGNYLLAVAAFIFAVAAKLPALLVAPAVFLLALQRSRWDRLAPWMLVVAPVLITGAYTMYAGSRVSPGDDFVTLILTFLMRSDLHVGMPAAAAFWGHFLVQTSITGVGLVPLAVGLPSSRLRGQAWFWAWGGALLLWCVLVVQNIRFEYYLLPLLPWLALAEGVGMAEILARLPAARLLLAGCLVLAMPLSSLGPLRELYRLNWPDYRIGTALHRALGPGTVILGTENPPILFYSRHHGWRTSKLTMAELHLWMSEGARYYIPVGSLSTPGVARFVRSHFALRVAGPAMYYALRVPAKVSTQAG